MSHGTDLTTLSILCRKSAVITESETRIKTRVKTMRSVRRQRNQGGFHGGMYMGACLFNNQSYSSHDSNVGQSDVKQNPP